MADVDLPSLLKSICGKLDKEFAYSIYVDEITQGFKGPCFFVETISASQRRNGYLRHNRTQTFCVHFFAEDGNERILAMVESLYFLLEYIQVNGCLCRGTGMHHNVVDDELHFFVDYNYHLLEVPESQPLMEQLSEHREELKHE